MCINAYDTCACRPCTYPNGLVVMFIVQFIMLGGFLLSFAGAGDCRFVKVDSGVVASNLTMIINPVINGTEKNMTERGLGLFFFEDSTGDCTWDRSYNKDAFASYWELVGRSDWQSAAGSAAAAAYLSLICFLWSMLFSCMAHPKILRYFLAMLMLVVMPILQTIPFRVLDSDFCNEHDCILGRTAYCAISAAILVFFAGALLPFARDYPGHDGGSMQFFLPSYPVSQALEEKGEHDENATLEQDYVGENNASLIFSHSAPLQSEAADTSIVDSQATTVQN